MDAEWYVDWATPFLCRFYDPDSLVYRCLLDHSRLVARRAVGIAERLSLPDPDVRFIGEAAMLHDIGIGQVFAPDIGCTGPHPYLAHGPLGRALLESIGMPRHALVCERHMGAGITEQEIRTGNLPLPPRDLLPLTREERIVAFADKFHSKGAAFLAGTPRGVDEIRIQMGRFGMRSVSTFNDWLAEFGEGPV